MKHIITIALALLGTSAHADDFMVAMKDFMQANLQDWPNDPVLVDAITAQNAMTASYDQARIDTLDATWRGFVGIDDAPMITGVLDNAAADFLRNRVAASGGIITEAFIMDARGLNVAASSATSDYWQGDEAKFTQTYPLGSGAVHFGDVELDESTQEVQGQISVAITDPASGTTIGALTVGVSLTELTLVAN